MPSGKRCKLRARREGQAIKSLPKSTYKDTRLERLSGGCRICRERRCPRRQLGSQQPGDCMPTTAKRPELSARARHGWPCKKRKFMGAEFLTCRGHGAIIIVTVRQPALNCGHQQAAGPRSVVWPRSAGSAHIHDGLFEETSSQSAPLALGGLRAHMW